MTEGHSLDSEIVQLAQALRCRGLADFSIPCLEFLEVWGFVGAQLLWMLVPFSEGTALTRWAEALERPDTLRRLQRYLMEGTAHQ